MNTRYYIGSLTIALLLGVAGISVAEIGTIEDTPAPTLLLPYLEVELSNAPNQTEDQHSTKHGGKHHRKQQQHEKTKTKSSSTNPYDITNGAQGSGVGNGSHGSGGKIDTSVGEGSHGSGGKINQTEDQNSANTKSSSSTLFDINNTAQSSGKTGETSTSNQSSGKDRHWTKGHKISHEQKKAARKAAYAAERADKSSSTGAEKQPSGWLYLDVNKSNTNSTSNPSSTTANGTNKEQQPSGRTKENHKHHHHHGDQNQGND